MSDGFSLIGDSIVSIETIGGNVTQLLLEDNYSIILDATISYKDGTPFLHDSKSHNLIDAEIISYNVNKFLKIHELELRLRNNVIIILVFKENSNNGFYIS
jgi:hypothetical protein